MTEYLEYAAVHIAFNFQYCFMPFLLWIFGGKVGDKLVREGHPLHDNILYNVVAHGCMYCIHVGGDATEGRACIHPLRHCTWLYVLYTCRW